MVLIGWRRFAIILGSKIDECAGCGAVGDHVLVRITWWGSLFWVPVLLLRFKHAMICAQCGAETGIPWLTMVRGAHNRSLPLDRARPRFEAMPPDASGFKPTPAQYFDPVTPNPKRSLGAWYFMIWPVLCAILICAVVGASILNRPPKTPLGQDIDTRMQDRYGGAHDCWIGGDGDIAGCKMSDGTLSGESVGTLTVCYFDEPVTEDTVHCRD
jgi:hypothetical protein